MKTLFTSIFLVISVVLFAQEKPFLIEGQVVDALMQPVPDVYVVNLNSHQRDISNANGVFSLRVTPGDSLIFSHISFFRQVVKISTLLLNPVVMLESEHVDIPEIRISANELSDVQRAEMNMTFLQTYKPQKMERMFVQNDPVYDIAVENNRELRTEASSIHLISFSPSEALHLLYSKFKRKDPLTDYSSTRKVVEPPVENKEK
ncbi:MAG TPA: carboxypeptidase-like regulatory domain-containing protein [Draconibacterium sp.]|nr:carboxypeptidase-like regulatory domain-containing protein [Draconibacterium sp.]